MISARHRKNSRGASTLVSMSAKSSCVRYTHEWNTKFKGLYHISNIKVTSLDMLATTVMFGIMCEIGSALVISCAGGRGPHVLP